MSPYDADASGRISRFSLDRKITVLVLVLTAVVIGSVAVYGIPVELMPRGFEDPSLWVMVPWQDAPPQEVQDKITEPLEEELSTVKGLKNTFSVTFTGMSRVFMTFKYGTDMDVAYREVRDRVERARTRFPGDVEQVFIRKDDADGIPVFVVGVAVDDELTDTYNLVQDEIILPISRIDGVASVRADGLEEKEIIIELDRERTNAAGLNIYQLGQELGSDNFTLASGNVRDGARKLLLRSVARYPDLEALENRMVAPNVRLKDIARIKYEEPEKTYRARAMSKPAVALIVLKEGDANASAVSEKISAVLDKIQANPRLRSFEMVPLFSQGEVISEALSTLLESGMIGGVIALMVLFLFLRRMRMTLIIAACIPLSLIIGITVMYFAGETLNLLTLLALMISVGLLVDNSVVVAENIHRLRRKGLGRREACINGAGEVGLAITMSTLTTVVVFLPVALVQGPAQFFLVRLATPVSVSLVASLVVALVFIPLAVFLTLERGDRERTSVFRQWHKRLNVVLKRIYDGTFGRLSRGYNGMLAFFLRRRFDMVLLLLVVFAATIFATVKEIEMVQRQEDERGGFFIGVDMPDNTTLDEAAEWFLAAEKVVESKKEELDLAGWFLFHRSRGGELQGWFNRPRTNGVSAKEATRIVKDALPRKPGIKLSTGREDQTEEDKDKGIHMLTMSGDDWQQLDRLVADLEPVFASLDGVLGQKKTRLETPNELGLVIDRDRAQQYQVNPQFIAGVVSYALRGTALPRYHQGGRDIPVRVRFEKEDRESLDELEDFLVPTETGSFIPVSALTDKRFLDTPGVIVRRDKQISRTITLELEEGREEEARENIETLVAGIDLPEGVTFGGVRRQTVQDDFAGLQFAGLLSVIFIYLLMGFLFESFILPLSIILTIPLAFIGVAWIHVLTGRDIDFLGAVGIVVLIGVVVNNGIVFIDYVNRLRQRGMQRHDALLLAADHRFRPIMMTAITTIGSLVPLALAGANSIGLSYTSFSLTLIGGMLTATLLTLLVVPIFYTLFDDARETFAALMRQLVGGRAGTTPAGQVGRTEAAG